MNSNPLLSVSAETAARKILNACAFGDANIVIGSSAKLLTFATTVAPNFVHQMLSLADRLLPNPEGGFKASVSGLESPSYLSPSILTTLSDRAVPVYNEGK